jgi:hypothetical protein
MEKIISLKKLFYILMCITILSMLYQHKGEAIAQDLSQKETINEVLEPGTLVNIVQIDENPEIVYSGEPFTFKATTDIPAKAVILKIDGKDYPMTGSGTDWSLKQGILKTGKIAYSIVAINADNVAGIAKTGTFNLKKFKEKRYTNNEDGTITDKVTGKVFQRFIDNGDGTVTDLFTHLMWAQSPAMLSTYDEAVEYCSNLSLGGHSGWRLPTATEWNNLIDKSQQKPVLPMGHPFKNIVYNDLFWSKTKHSTLASRIYVADLSTGKIGAQSITKEYYIWPVRAIMESNE